MTAAGDAIREEAGMVRIPGGTFFMGSDRHYPEERPAHTVRVGDGVRYWLESPESRPDGWRARLNLVLLQADGLHGRIHTAAMDIMLDSKAVGEPHICRHQERRDILLHRLPVPNEVFAGEGPAGPLAGFSWTKAGDPVI